MKNKKGISLITLIITIVVMLIIAGAVILNVVNTNIVEESDKAAKESNKAIATDEVKLVVYNLYLKESQIQMTDDEIKKELENKLKKHDSSSTVEKTDDGFVANHRGYVFEINDGYEIAIKETNDNEDEIFNAEKWDKDATDENLFEWDETRTIIVGYKEALTNATKIRIPSKCVAIQPTTLWQASHDARANIVGGIKKVELPQTVTIIGNCAFADFRSLTDINVPITVTNIDNRAFSNCHALRTIILPSSITNIGEYAFANCLSIENITIPNGIQCINDSTFSGCSKLTQITIPDSITSIGNYAFSFCESLTNITLPDNITSIGTHAFSSCTSIKSIIIPDSVINMGDFVFYNWTSNQTLYFEIKEKPDSWNEKWNYNYNYQLNHTEIEANMIWGYTGE